MKKMVWVCCLCICALLWSADVQAHFLWIETSPQATNGKTHEVNIYYGEYMDNQREIIGQRFNEVKDFTAWVISPSGKKTKLELKEAKDHFTGSFVPQEAGNHVISLENLEREVVDWSKYEIGIIRPTYYATATVSVKGSSASPDQAVVNGFSMQQVSSSAKKETPVTLKVNFNKLAPKKQKLMVYAPNGWAKEIETDEKGEAVFTPLWDGMYLVEAIYNENTPGNFKGKDYEQIRHRAIYTVYIN